ncbi:23429_t:CDS:2 [Gigaspora margarita]|uniref:23429_t:CDS:1 n=1 Tax=Gigaspora margarita TaxID=4874 RepID=A0ABM8VW37_GIGMA|nr:23429_t:CDS:2 [Gigaspora margarita]
MDISDALYNDVKANFVIKRNKENKENNRRRVVELRAGCVATVVTTKDEVSFGIIDLIPEPKQE